MNFRNKVPTVDRVYTAAKERCHPTSTHKVEVIDAVRAGAHPGNHGVSFGSGSAGPDSTLGSAI